ncbi:hypothetical protein KP509_32G066500 [Ceratopteris richardii]|uniref:Uncharacterized protein n=1 Tax=Ceratopteris richardii TaxID=49495 RepID=A0A8T2QVH6_CERRI|nr:hypothetical protein KP509_32G066500 [Ceratopteris richardii]
MSFVTVRQRYNPYQLEVESQQHNQQALDAPFDYLNALRLLLSSPSRYESSWRYKLESFLWIASAAFIVYYGDFRTNFLLLLATDARIHRPSFNLGLMFLLLDIAIILYVAYRLRTLEKAHDRLVMVAQGTVPAATLFGVTTFSLFSYALWPIWRFLTIPMLFTLFMALMVIIPYLAPYFNAKLDMDALRGIYIRPAE